MSQAVPLGQKRARKPEAEVEGGRRGGLSDVSLAPTGRSGRGAGPLTPGAVARWAAERGSCSAAQTRSATTVARVPSPLCPCTPLPVPCHWHILDRWLRTFFLAAQVSRFSVLRSETLGV